MTTSYKNDAQDGYVETDGSIEPTFASVVAGGSNSQANSTAITRPITVVTTVSSTTRGVRLPTPANVGAYYTVYNASATTMNVYPQTNGKLGTAATNAALTVATNKGQRFWAQSATQWRAVGP